MYTFCSRISFHCTLGPVRKINLVRTYSLIEIFWSGKNFILKLHNFNPPMLHIFIANPTLAKGQVLSSVRCDWVGITNRLNFTHKIIHFHLVTNSPQISRVYTFKQWPSTAVYQVIPQGNLVYAVAGWGVCPFTYHKFFAYLPSFVINRKIYLIIQTF